jgi:hypothetical protein
MLHVAALFAFTPEPLPRPAEIHSPIRRQRFFPRFPIHMRDHKHRTRRRILRNGRH